MWNWEQERWPNFEFNVDEFKNHHERFIHKSGVMKGCLKHIDTENEAQFKIDILSMEAFKTSEIEGELLNKDSLQSSIRKHFGLQHDKRKVEPSEFGISLLTCTNHKTFSDELSHDVLFDWHKMIMNGRIDLDNVGSYRAHEDQMQIISGNVHKPTIHFVAPPSEKVFEEMQNFISWFNCESLNLPPLIRAGVAHLYFESIHPFEDGNGRIGRAIADKVLAQMLKEPSLIATSWSIQERKKAYYQALHDNSKSLNITSWLHYYCDMVLLAQDKTLTFLEFIITKVQFFREYQDQLNDRQLKVIKRLFEAGPEGFKGGLSSSNYQSITKATSASSTRDLRALVDCGALVKTGALKSTRYHLNLKH